jgi:hypothetical protein
MNFKRNKHWDKPFSPRIAKRVQRIPTAELTRWGEQAINELGRTLIAYERTGSPELLLEARTGAEAVHAVIEAIAQRNGY